LNTEKHHSNNNEYVSSQSLSPHYNDLLSLMFFVKSSSCSISVNET
jgi:hypothetical protein